MGARMKYDELPGHLKRQVDRMLTTDRQSPPVPTAPVKDMAAKASKLTATERKFEAVLVARYGRENVVFQGVSLRMRNGHRYTPDFAVIPSNSVAISTVLLVEVKGTYRLGSYQRARLATMMWHSRFAALVTVLALIVSQAHFKPLLMSIGICPTC